MVLVYICTRQGAYPVTRAAERNTLTPVLARIHLCNASPSHRSPRTRERSQEKCSKDNHHVTNRLIAVPLGISEFEVAERGEDEEAHAHPKSAQGEAFPASEFLDHVETREGAHHVDRSEDDLRDEGVRNTDGSENCCSVADNRC